MPEHTRIQMHVHMLGHWGVIVSHCGATALRVSGMGAHERKVDRLLHETWGNVDDRIGMQSC